MKAKQIVFTEMKKAELLNIEVSEPKDNEVTVKTAFTTISSGTEKANLMGCVTVDNEEGSFPRTCGYSGSGVVVKVGKDVKSVKVGDRVVRIWGHHKSYENYNEKSVVKIPDGVDFNEASMAFISTFPMAAVRKMKVEIGESAMVVGLGILGILGVGFLKSAGAVPVIAVDPVKSRRELAIKMGADYALDPNEEGFSAKVKELSNGGINAAIEVTGVGKALDQTLDCMAKYGRVALLGCTRDFNFTIDYYKKVHFPGVQLIGAHTLARQEEESAPNNWTHRDDINAVFNLLKYKRVNFKDIIAEVHSPDSAYEVYKRLADDRDFPVVVQFNWGDLE